VPGVPGRQAVVLKPICHGWHEFTCIITSRSSQLDAIVTMKFLIRSVCNEGDFGPGEPHETLDELVRDLISEETIGGLADDSGTVISVEVAP
jgi:hypothetical protein